MCALPQHYALPMAPEKERKPARDEIEVAWYTKELGRPLQRKMLQRRLDDFLDSSSGNPSGHHGDDRTAKSGEPPPEDRAG